MSSEKYVGLDVHQATISVAVMDSQGKIIMESILENQSLYSSGVLRWTARELFCDLRRRRLGRGWKIAKVATARRMAIRLYWLWRKGWDYAQVKKFGSPDSPKQAMMFSRTSSN